MYSLAMRFSWLCASIFVFAGILTGSEEVTGQCNQSDALLHISYSKSVAESEWASYRTRLLIHPSELAGNSSVHEYESYYLKPPADYQACVRRKDACFFVSVQGIPKNFYEIYWDGKTVEIGPELYSKRSNETVTEIGEACVPVCNEATEALFEYKLLSPLMSLTDSFRLQDKDGSMIVDCSDQMNSNSDCRRNHAIASYRRLCLPKESACYNFLIGDGYEQIPWIHDDWPTFSISYDGNLVYETDRWLFKSIQFGGHCTPVCDPDTQSLVEFFMHRQVHGEKVNGSIVVADWQKSYAKDFSWELRMHKEDTLISSGIVSAVTDPLTHKQICVPKDSCLYFNISSPDDGPLSPTYLLTMDGDTYRKANWYLQDDSLNQVTKMGRCADESLCSATEALFELQFDTQNISSLWLVSWFLQNTKSNRFEKRIASNFYFDRAAPASRFVLMECVPREECLFKFAMTKDAQVKGYTIKRNGAVLFDRTVMPDDDVNYYGMVTTDFGCPDADEDKLSVGAIVGIVIASVAVVVGAPVLIFLYWKRRQNASGGAAATQAAAQTFGASKVDPKKELQSI